MEDVEAQDSPRLMQSCEIMVSLKARVSRPPGFYRMPAPEGRFIVTARVA